MQKVASNKYEILGGLEENDEVINKCPILIRFRCCYKFIIWIWWMKIGKKHGRKYNFI